MATRKGTTAEADIIEVGDGYDMTNLLHIPDSIEKSMKDRGMEPRWGNVDSKRLSRRLAQGYRVVDEVTADDAPSGLQHQTDSTLVRGDAVLLERPIAVGDVYRAKLAAQSKQRMDWVRTGAKGDSGGLEGEIDVEQGTD